MRVSHKITGSEREVMEVLWGRTEPMQTRELLEVMREKGKKWKRQTLNTLLFRLEEKGIVGPFEGSKPRQLLITKEQWQEMKFRQDMTAEPAPAAVPAFKPELDEPPFALDVEEDEF